MKAHNVPPIKRKQVTLTQRTSNEQEEVVVHSPSQDADEECRPRDDEEKEDADECLEDKDVSDIKVSEDNPFLSSWIDDVSNGSCHPRSDECTEESVTNTMLNKFLVEKMPTKAMTKKTYKILKG